MMEPTTVIALRSMEKAGLIRRVRSKDDRRITHVRLTAKAKRMRDGLLQLAREINAQADEGIPAEDIAVFRRVIARMTKNWTRSQKGLEEQGSRPVDPRAHSTLMFGGLHHLGDALDLAVEQLAEFGGVAADRLDADFRELRDDLRLLHDRRRLRRDLLIDRGRRADAGINADERRIAEARDEFGDRRQLRRLRRARQRRWSQAA